MMKQKKMMGEAPHVGAAKEAARVESAIFFAFFLSDFGTGPSSIGVLKAESCSCQIVTLTCTEE